MDGKPLTFDTKKLKNNHFTGNDQPCPCGGRLYAAPSARFVKCSAGGELRCTSCLREARRFRGGITCGPGCEKIS